MITIENFKYKRKNYQRARLSFHIYKQQPVGDLIKLVRRYGFKWSLLFEIPNQLYREKPPTLFMLDLFKSDDEIVADFNEIVKIANRQNIVLGTNGCRVYFCAREFNDDHLVLVAMSAQQGVFWQVQ